MTRQLVVITCWAISAAAIGYVLFAEGAGLLHAGPYGCLGLALIGLGIARQMGLGDRRRPAAQTAPAHSADR